MNNIRFNPELQFWIFQHKDQFDFKFHTEEKLFLNQIFFRSNWITTLGGRNFTGHGLDVNLKISLMKAISESLERSLISQHKIETTNGLAAHPVLERGFEIARDELIERDSFLGHWYSGTHPWFRESIQTEFGEFELYELASSVKSTNVAMAVSRFKDGHVIGLGAGKDWKMASNKAMSELASIKMGVMDLAPLSLADFSKLQAPTPIDHIRWGLSQECFNYTQAWLKGGSKQTLEELQNKICKPAPQVEELKWLISDSPPLHFVRATGQGYLQLFFGGPANHLQKLASISLWNGEAGPINIPHPFG